MRNRSDGSEECHLLACGAYSLAGVYQHFGMVLPQFQGIRISGEYNKSKRSYLLGILLNPSHGSSTFLSSVIGAAIRTNP